MLKLDYSVENVLIKNLSSAECCQRCGAPTKEALCAKCKSEDLAKLPKYRTGIYDGMLHAATVSGLHVYVDGRLHHTAKDLFESKALCGSLNRMFSASNGRVAALMGGRAR